jgi:hypothetical protein
MHGRFVCMRIKRGSEASIMYIALNYALCILFMMIILVEVYLVIARNKKIIVRGHDDFFIGSMVLLGVLLLFPYSDRLDWLEALRNTTAIVAVLASFAIRRGITNEGIRKLFFLVKWENVKNVRIEQHLTNKLALYFAGRKANHMLIFSYAALKKMVYQLQQHGFDVPVANGVWTKYNEYSKT